MHACKSVAYLEGNHQNCLEREALVALLKASLEGDPKQVHDHYSVVATRSKVAWCAEPELRVKLLGQLILCCELC